MSDQPEELRRRIAVATRESGTRGLDTAAWAWLLVLGVLVPALLLVWGWTP